MVISGLVMISESGTRLLAEHEGYFTFTPIAHGVESKLQWQSSGFAIEFEYTEGFEYEQVIPFDQLPIKTQKQVLSKKGNSDHIVIEEIFGFGTHAYEAYYFKNKEFINSIELSD